MKLNKEQKTVLIIIIIVLALIVISAYLLWKPITLDKSKPLSPEVKNKDVILSELERLNIEVVGQPKHIEIELPFNLSGPNWGLKKTICEEGGYDLTKYVNRDVVITSYDVINEVYEHTDRSGIVEEFPLRAQIMVVDNEIACVYKIVREDTTLAPGIFSVKQYPYIKKK